MDLMKYFESVKGRGVLATADKNGKANLALYARPHFIDDHTVAFIMTEKLTHENLKTNPWAAYLFSEEEWKNKGIRLYIRKIKEEENPDLCNLIFKKCDYPSYEAGNKYLVHFNIEKTLPLIDGFEAP